MPVRIRRPRWLPDAGGPRMLAEILRRETVGGVLALGAAVIALLWANLAPASYDGVRHHTLGPLDLEHWAGEAALAVFFLVAGLELKRELVVGSLRRPADAAVPVVAATCGVFVPALVFVMVNLGSGDLTGWAVPSATDIAFALALLAVVGRHLPRQLRAFLLTLAVVDDLIVVAVIAVFFTSDLDLPWLVLGVVCLAAYALLHRRGAPAALLVVLPLLAWWATLSGGVHATVAGIVVGLLTPVRTAERLEHRLGPVSTGLAVPFFALLSAGVTLDGVSMTEAVPIGVVAGLVLGKPLGVLGGSWVLTRFTHAELDPAVRWRDLFGLALLTGVGFTVSLLVSDLAYADARQDQAKAAVLLGSVVSAALAAAVLGRRSRVHARRSDP